MECKKSSIPAREAEQRNPDLTTTTERLGWQHFLSLNAWNASKWDLQSSDSFIQSSRDSKYPKFQSQHQKKINDNL